ncbi:MAG: WD40 repeat domain-containing protein, partial [Ferruginibacter sp.]
MFKSLKATFTIGLFIIALCCNAQEPKLMLPIGDKASLSSLYFSPDGSKIAIPGWKNERIYIWDVNTGKILTTVNVQDEYFNINRFSQDGKRLLVNYGEIWDIENQQLLLNIDSVLFNIDSTLFYKRKIEFEIDSVLSIIDTTALGSHSWSKEFREKAISDCADKNPEAVSICKCAFNKIEIKYPNEKEVAAKVTIHDFNLMCKECVIRDTIYNLRDTANIEILPNWGIVEFNSNLTQVAISKDSIIYLINIPQNKIIGKLNSDKISSLTYSPDGKYLAGIAKNQILVWNIEDHKFLYNIGSANKIFFTPDSKKLITSDSAKITIHDIFTGKSLTEFLSDKVESMAFSSDSKKIIVSINEDGKNEKYKAILFDIDKSKVLNKWANISNILFYPDNESIIVTYVLDSAIGAKVEIWNSNTNKLVGSRNIYSNLLEISDDGSKIAEDGQEYNLVTIVNSKTGAKISEWNWQGHIPKDGIEKLKGSRIIISYKTHVNIWDSQTGEWLPYASIGNNDDDNKILASDSSTSALLKNGIWQIWNSRSEKLILKSNKKFSGNVVSCISGNSQQVAFAFQNKEKRFLEIYDLKELKKVKQFPLPSSPLKDIFFSPDNTKLILSYEDLNITEIRQASTFLLVKKIPGHISEFSPDGTKVIINLGEKDGSQSVYSITNVNTGRILLHDYGVAIFSPIENIIVNNSGNIYNLKNNKTL